MSIRGKLGLLLGLVGAASPPLEPVRPAFDVNIYPPPLSEEERRESSWDRNQRRKHEDERKRKKKARKQRKKTRGY